MQNGIMTRQQIAIRIAGGTSPAEREALASWLRQLLELRAASLPAFYKARDAMAATLNRDVIWPVVKTLAKETKRLGWDERTTTARFGLGGAATGIALFGGQTAGLAALGTAVAVPLWIVFGAGAAFARVLYDELAQASAAASIERSDKVLDARKDADGVHRA